MPPQRTTIPAKPVKTERTHEENQERAYIAASRRSDRSLEARVESARRASEIHKRRTGRSLRVTEQDVINEEMYEEEDDDLPYQYRRLTAHLQTGSADFNRRLAAYLTNHVAMRTALDQAITASYAQQYPHAPRFAHDQAGMFPSPMLPPTPHQQTVPSTASTYRQSPYPMPGTPAFLQKPHMRSSSVANADEMSKVKPETVSPDQRRKSVQLGSAMSSTAPALVGETPSAVKVEEARSDSIGSAPQYPKEESRLQQTSSARDQGPSSAWQAGMPFPFGANIFCGDMGPLSMSLPMESQMLLGPALNPMDPLTSMFMSGSEAFPRPWGDMTTGGRHPSSELKTQNAHPSYEGMYATLAPSALDLSATSPPEVKVSSDRTISSTTSGPSFELHPDSVAASLKTTLAAPALTRTDSLNGGTGTSTPGMSEDWGLFLNDILWE